MNKIIDFKKYISTLFNYTVNDNDIKKFVIKIK